MIIKTFDTIEKLNIYAAEKTIEIADASIRSKGNFTFALAGGSTPKSLYRLLASEEFRNRIDWTRVRFFFGDERNVASDNEESNFRMANENLFLPLKTSPDNIFRWQTELKNPAEIAEDYERTIKEFFNLTENELPRFDLFLLGMGGDGHTASLFPHTEALKETEKIVVSNPVEKLKTARLTFTFPTINNAANVIFLVAGADKAKTLAEVLQGDFQPEKFPSQNIKPENGNLFWLIDEKAAALLK